MKKKIIVIRLILFLPMKISLLLFNILLTTNVLVKVNKNKKWSLVNLFMLSIYSWVVIAFVEGLSTMYITFVMLSFIVPFVIIVRLNVESKDF